MGVNIMDYRALNNNQRLRMNQICKNSISLEWEDPSFMEILSGKLPTIKKTSKDSVIKDELFALESVYDKYDYSKTDRHLFLEEVKRLCSIIKEKADMWYGLSIPEVEEVIKQHEFCIIAGEGGIGKSYFIKCLEERIEAQGIPHLFLYGKFEKTTDKIDVAQILSEADANGFIFAFDAINEMTAGGREGLLKLIETLQKHKKVRIILTYRTNTLDKKTVDSFEGLAAGKYRFPGVSYESALEELIKHSVPDIDKYQDILFSNNALMLNMLCSVLGDEHVIDESKNNIATITFILETYIKQHIKKCTPRGTDTAEIWRDVKRIATWMYEKESRDIPLYSLNKLVKTGDAFLPAMKQAAIMESFTYDGEDLCVFAIDSLTDFLIARSLFDDISGKEIQEQKNIIETKKDKIGNLDEAIILAIFDNMSPDYKRIATLLDQTKLMSSLRHETILKIRFQKEWIEQFQTVFSPQRTDDLIQYFAGYSNKPYNCVSFLNRYYAEKYHELHELSAALSGTFFIDRVKRRLKNLLYYLAINESSPERKEEAFSFATWCCAAPNRDIRYLAEKMLFEILNKNEDYVDQAISFYGDTCDYYIKEAIIYILSSLYKYYHRIHPFFESIIESDYTLSAKSIKRIASFLGEKHGYIHWQRKNLYDLSRRETDGISDEMDHLLFRVDIHDKGFLPFRYWGKDNINEYRRFLLVDKDEVYKLNQQLSAKYQCVRSGECNGSMAFENWLMSEFRIGYKGQLLNRSISLQSFEQVMRQIFSEYQAEFNADRWNQREEELFDSLQIKCVDIATGLYYGSLMCNYYTDNFATFNSSQEIIGYEVYDPLEYEDEEESITAPIPIFNSLIEQLDDLVIAQISVPEEKDIHWVKNASLTRDNLLSVINTSYVLKDEWVLLAARISLREETKHGSNWIDNYNLWCCTSAEETIKNDGKARYLTIELNTYNGCIDEYNKLNQTPYLCKKVRGLKYSTGLFDETFMVLPPADIVRALNLYPDCTAMTWTDEMGMPVIICNNNKNSYYSDPIGETVFIKKDYLKKYLEDHTIKYFAFTEKFIPATGYADETSIHYEIKDGVIVKEISNAGGWGGQAEDKKPLCQNCPYGVELKTDIVDSEIRATIEKLMSKYD